MRRTFLPGSTFGSDIILEELPPKLSKSGKTLWRRVKVKCKDCGRERECSIGAHKNYRITPRCVCKRKYPPGAVFGSVEILSIEKGGKATIKCLKCGRIQEVSSLYNHLKRKECMYCRQNKTVDRDKAATILYENGFSLQAIGEIMNISKQD